MPNETVKPVDTFIQPKITGYRQLNADEAAMMNEAKAPERVAELDRLDNAEPARWLAMGRTSIQVGIMQIVRSIAQPAS